MSTIVTRAGKGSPLTHTEVDNNFTNLNTDKLQSGDTVASLTISSADINGGTIDGTAIGSSSASTGAFTSLSDSGNLTFTGTGNRILGDFSGAVADRVAFQSSTANGSTTVAAIPNGTATISVLRAYAASDLTNATYGDIVVQSTSVDLRSTRHGTGTLVPLTFQTGGSEKVRIETGGNVGIGTSSPSYKLDITGQARATTGWAVSADGSTFTPSGLNAIPNYGTGYITSTSTTTLAGFGGVSFYTNQAERMSLDGSGNLVFKAAGQRITGDFSGASLPNRLMFQTSTANGNTLVGFIPNGTGSSAATRYFNNSSAENCAQFDVGMLIAGTEARIASGIVGTGTYVPITFSTGGSERVRIDTSGNVGIGTSSPNGQLDINSASPRVVFSTGGTARGQVNIGGSAMNITVNDVTFPLTFNTGGGERMRIDSSGNLLVGKTALGTAAVGFEARPDGLTVATRENNGPLLVNRTSSDGTVVSIRQDNTEEGTISVSGTTVSYNGGHLARYAQTVGVKDESLLKGTVLSNLDEMNTYVDEEGNPVANEQLNKVKVSDVEGDADVAGVFVNWSYDEQHSVDEINMAMTGDMIIRIAQGVTVNRGDLLMSAGDGTAKPQGDDIVRSKTIAKVTSTNITCTYADGSYCVPCVLMAC